MSRVAIIGNAAGGKSTLARQMSLARSLPLVEIDNLLWKEGWHLAPPAEYNAKHAAAIAQDEWIIEGLGTQASIPARIARATEVVLFDLPLWVEQSRRASCRDSYKASNHGRFQDDVGG